MRLRSRFGLVAALLFAFVLGVASTAGAQQFELLSSFAGCPPEGCGPAGDAAKPREPLVLGPDGNFYGTSPIDWGSNVAAPRGWGTVFRVSPDGARTVLHHFPGTDPGGCGSASVTFGADGRLYGVGTRCGSTGSDTIYRLDGASFEVLQEFPAGAGLRSW